MGTDIQQVQEGGVVLTEVQDKIITVRNQHVLLDSDVAVLYGVETRDVNKAVKNNPDKFPEGYIFELNKGEKMELVENFHRFNRQKHSTVLPSAFTKKGCYMLATILKSPRATKTTIAIIDAFEKMHEMSMSIVELMKDHKNEEKQKTWCKKESRCLATL